MLTLHLEISIIKLKSIIYYISAGCMVGWLFLYFTFASWWRWNLKTGFKANALQFPEALNDVTKYQDIHSPWKSNTAKQQHTLVKDYTVCSWVKRMQIQEKNSLRQHVHIQFFSCQVIQVKKTLNKHYSVSQRLLH